MPNELKFDVEFTRHEIKKVLKSKTKYIVVKGTYKYDPKKGEYVWDMDAVAKGENDKGDESSIQVKGCPRPCYTTLASGGKAFWGARNITIFVSAMIAVTVSFLFNSQRKLH